MALDASSTTAEEQPAAKRQRTSEIPVLDKETYRQRSVAARKRTNPTGHFLQAMYSSLVDGIVTDPELMVMPLDDHAIIRGHAIFDTASLVNGRVYQLGEHLDRLFTSARDARLTLPFGADEAENRKRMTDIVCQTCVASGLRDGSIRYWLSAGPGNFGFTPDGCEPAFYCVAYRGGPVPSFDDSITPHNEAFIRLNEVPMKPPLLARVKSNNYMLNCLTAMEAQKKGGKFGIMVRDDDTIAESCVLNVIFVTKDRVMLTPEFGDILRGTTVRKSMELANNHLVGDASEEGKLLKEVRQQVVTMAQAKNAVEVILVGGDTHLFPVKCLDGQQVGNGGVGPVAEALNRLLLENAQRGDDQHIVLEYP